MFFLTLLALASQRIEHVVLSVILFFLPEITVDPLKLVITCHLQFLSELRDSWLKYERGCLPKPVELLVILWVQVPPHPLLPLQGYAWEELKQLWKSGIIRYLSSLWNLCDIFCLGSFMGWIGLRGLAFLMVQKEIWEGVEPENIWIPRQQWATFEPQNLADAAFGAGMIVSYLKVGLQTFLYHQLSWYPCFNPPQERLNQSMK